MMISIHAPREGRDDTILGYQDYFAEFQSTRPARGATIMDWFGDTFFIISIHAPREGRDEHQGKSRQSET